jgi:hypothetical protein
VKKNKAIYISSAAIIILIILLILLVVKNNDDSVQSDRKATDKNLLVADWLRTDASYLIKINKVYEDGNLEPQYFNPKPINVVSAIWLESYGNLKIIVELQDVNYPGSRYTLSYLPDRDILAGDYYQAVQGLTFYVEFTRNK